MQLPPLPPMRKAKKQSDQMGHSDISKNNNSQHNISYQYHSPLPYLCYSQPNSLTIQPWSLQNNQNHSSSLQQSNQNCYKYEFEAIAIPNKFQFNPNTFIYASSRQMLTPNRLIFNQHRNQSTGLSPLMKNANLE